MTATENREHGEDAQIARNCSFIIAQSYSGYAVTGLAETNRIVMSATGTNEKSWTNTGKIHWAFLFEGSGFWPTIKYNGLIKSIGSSNNPISLKNSMQNG